MNNNFANVNTVNIALLSVGTELLLGDTINTNLSSLGQILYSNGFILSSEITVPDNKENIKDEFLKLLENNDVVITCGGIGPTEDDFTKEVICSSLNINLEVDDEHLSWMKSRWESRGLSMPETNIKQAEIPVGSKKLNNSQGTAPGILINHSGKYIFILPGPPREFNPLVIDQVVPLLKENFPKTNKDYEFVLFFNQAESSLADEINKFKPEGIDIAYLASKGIIKLRYDKNSVNEVKLNKFLNQLDTGFKDSIISYENIPASKALFNLLKEKKLTLSLVESITGGNLSSEIINFPGASSVLLAANTLYSNEAKKEFLSNNISDDWDALSKQLAEKSLEKYNSSISLAILGEAGPIPSSEYKIGEIFIAISNKKETVTFNHKLRGSREDIIARSVNNAIWDLINFIK